MSAIVAPNAAIYYTAGYWNDIKAVKDEISKRISGRTDVGYLQYFAERVGKTFGRALFLNCGNGWVERDFFKHGLIESAVGIDYSEELLAEARRHGRDLPIRYVRGDINDAVFDERFDLIVNYAAAHHIAYPDRVFRNLCRHLVTGGYFVNYDYIGPHRNQYPYEQWEAVWRLNNSLPREARQTLRYPHFPTMLHDDPTEAIHSELTLETYGRYFTTDEYRAIGGALAYPILNFHRALERLEPTRRDEIVETVMTADRRYLADNPGTELFAFWYGTPKHAVLRDRALLRRWEEDERVREERAQSTRGHYYEPTLLQAMLYPDAFPVD
ncbi:MAG: class I SAM-dependent methyltransferase [Candidatus Eremiobacteraeota bacterium]|nr:class I SAM-dependent methyltransferase [Candidatus Eremiobacteraeota bacterium]MBV9407801.1 class I SAM-dependent methyltransferase [Candidatus Eremiobacteraeota bacterium]